MTAVYSEPNQAWMVLLGNAIQEIRYRRFWPNKTELADDLRTCGLSLTKDNKIVSMDDICRNCSAPLPPGGGCKACSFCGTSNGCS